MAPCRGFEDSAPATLPQCRMNDLEVRAFRAKNDIVADFTNGSSERYKKLMATPRILILRAPGANCDAEAQFAFELAGGSEERVHINRLREQPKQLMYYQ